MMFNLNILFKISLFVWLIFIPMKTSFYQISYALMILLFLIYIFTNKKVTQFTKIIYEQKTILIAFFCNIEYDNFKPYGSNFNLSLLENRILLCL